VEEESEIPEKAMPPNPPSVVDMFKAGDDFMEIFWSPDEANWDSIRGYTLRMLTGDEVDHPDPNEVWRSKTPDALGTLLFENKDRTRCTVVQVKPGMRYAFSVQARNQAGRSDYSTPCGFAPFWSPLPEIPKLAVYGPQSLVFYWKPYPEHKNPVTGYIVEYRQEGASKWDKVEDNTMEELAWILLDLNPSTKYEVRVSSTHEKGGWSRAAAVFGTPAPWVPAAPLAAKLVSKAKTELTLEWEEPCNNGAPITGYTLRVQRVGGKLVNPALDRGLVTSFELTKLRSKSDYLVTLTAHNEIGESKLSDSEKYATL